MINCRGARSFTRSVALSLAIVALAGFAPAPWTVVAYAQTVPAPPPEPEVKPEIPDIGPFDAGGDRVDDAIQADLAAIRGALGTAAPTQAAQLQARLAAPIRIELVFSSQITQQQIDDFLALGGEIDHVYRAVSYGWNGRLAREDVESIPAVMGQGFVIVT